MSMTGSRFPSLIDRTHPPVASAVVEIPEWDPTHVYAWKPANNYKGWKLIDRGEAGVDDASVIQSALDSLPAGRTWKERVMAIGSFEIGETIKIPSYTIFDIYGLLKLKDGANTTMIQNSDQTNGNKSIEIYGHLDGNASNQTDPAASGIIFDAPKGNENEDIVINVIAENFYGHGVHIKGTKNAMIKVLSKNSGHSSDNLYHNVYLRRVYNFNLKAISIGCVNGKGLKVTLCEYFKVSVVSKDNALEGAYFGSCKYFTAKGVSAGNGVAEARAGVRVLTEEAGVYPINWKIDFVSYGNSGDGARIQAGNGVVTGVYSGNNGHGINLDDATKVVVTGVRARDNGGYGIAETGDSSDVNLIVANICQNNTSGGISTYGTNTHVADNLT